MFDCFPPRSGERSQPTGASRGETGSEWEPAPEGRKRVRDIDPQPFKYGNISLNADDEEVRINS